MRFGLNNSKKKMIPGVFATVAFCAGLVNGVVFADGTENSATDVITVKVANSCTLSGSGNDSHSGTIRNGEFKGNIGSTTYSIFCNDGDGFAVYAVGFTGNQVGNNYLVDGSLSSSSNIPTGVLTGSEGDSDGSAWSMKLGRLANADYPIIAGGSDDSDTGDTTDYSTYQAVPSDYDKVAYRTSNTIPGGGDEGFKFTSTYATYISWTQPAGSYSGQVKYTLIHPSTAPTPTSPPEPLSRCSTPVPGINYMQEINSENYSSVLNSMTKNEQYFLRDRRDEEPYCVSRLNDGTANGTIWMTQNLNITGTIMALDSNFAGDDVDISQCDLDVNVGECTGSSDRKSFSVPMTHESSDKNIGAWYNYAAATAGTITGSSNSSAATADICPSGWRLPFYSGYNEVGSFNSIVNNASVSFNASTGGYYSSTVMNTNEAYYLSSSSINSEARYNLYHSGGNRLFADNTNNRYIGAFVRCVYLP